MTTSTEKQPDIMQIPVGMPLHKIEQQAIERTLAFAGSVTSAAIMLGIHRRTLQRKLVEYREQRRALVARKVAMAAVPRG